MKKAPNRGVHRKQRDRSAWPGMMLHQDGSQHLWVPGQYWDLIVTMDDATNEHYSMFFCDEEGTQLDNIFCERYERQVRKDNCIEFEGLTLQIPADRHRYHYIKAKVKVLRHTDGALSLWHGPRKLAGYDATGQLIKTDLPVAA